MRVKQKSLHTILIILLLSGSIQTLRAQISMSAKESDKNWFVGMNGGANVFYGDIKFKPFWPATKMHELQAGGGFIFGRKLSPSFKLSSELNFTALKGMEELLTDTLGFDAQALSFALKGHLNPIALFSKKDAKFAFYIESGIGLMGWKSLLQNQSSDETINNLGWDNPNKEFAFYIAAGVQLEYQINPRFSTYLKSNYNLVFSDLLDGEALGGFDSYSFTAFGFNYHFGKQKEAPKLLPYSFYESVQDSIQTSSNSEAKEEIKVIADEQNNPFSLSFNVPEKIENTGFDISINIVKTGIPSTGFFRLLVPSGFLPQAASKGDVSFTKLGHRYEYDFILPMNQDSTSIPIHINLSEIEKGMFPILIEGEIMDQKGKLFPIKFASYTEIISEEAWQELLSIEAQKKYAAKKAKENQLSIEALNTSEIAKKVEIPAWLNASETIEEEAKKEITRGVYRIQIMASKNQFADLDNFKSQHKITESIFVAQAEGWYRYNLYETKDKKEANRLCALVRNENSIPQAFVTYYENGKRVLMPASSQSSKSTVTSTSSPAQKPIITKPSKIAQQQEGQLPESNFIYRIEIALVYDKPIPLYILKEKVGQEKISEFKQNQTYIYTIGEFADFEVARAFLSYVKTQFRIDSAQIGQYQNNKRIKLVF